MLAPGSMNHHLTHAADCAHDGVDPDTPHKKKEEYLSKSFLRKLTEATALPFKCYLTPCMTLI